ncbi:T9SS type A sorting domain-containing protein [Flavobacterium sp.]|jgi:hypothetical protein|uniref:T9SS type A sorting domain-containing protein n=1 Tax=Flavobacterium sp. TaxID=239 RepID=UPI0037BF27E0
MKKIYFLLSCLIAVTSYGQTIYTENFGTPASTTLITAYTGWQASTPIAYSGSGDVRTSSASTGYVGASGSGNVFLTSTAGKNLIISGINTSTFTASDIQLSFGYTTSSTTTQLVVEKSTDGTTWAPITFTNNANTNWNLVTIPGGQIPASTTLSLRFTQPATAQMRIDDVKLAAVSASCTLVLGTPVIACVASTSALDNYTATIPFTGGATGTYVITATGATITGDNPSTAATGSVILTYSESTLGTYSVVIASGPTCSFTFNVTSPDSCIGTNTVPVNEPFNYTAGTALNFSQMWKNTSVGSDEILAVAGNLSYTGITATGNSVALAGTGSDTLLPFTDSTSGDIYASFLIKVTDLTGISTTGSTYFATFSNATNVYSGKIWIKTNGTQFQYGISTTTVTADIVWSPNLYNVNTTQYLVLGYNFTNNLLALYENPTIGGSSSASISTTPAAALTSIANFIFRQDSATSTPAMILDELKITTTPNFTLSNQSFSQIDGLKMYPNPAKNNLFIETALNSDINVAIVDVLGKEVINSKVSNSAVNISGLTPGMYIVKITEEGKTSTKKLIIE